LVVIVAVLVAAGSLSLGSAAAARSGGTVSARHGKVMLVLGESTQAGEGASNVSNSHAALFFQYLDSVDAADALVNLAVPGETSSSFQRGMHSQLAQALQVIKDPRTDVTVVSFMLGGNDVPFDYCLPEAESPECQAAFGDAMRQLSRNLSVILQRLSQALASDPGVERIFVQSYYQPFSGTGVPFEASFDALWLGQDGVVNCAANAGRPQNVGLNDVIACTAKRYGATIVDLYPPFVGRGLELTHIADFDVHPNDAGHMVIAEALIDAYKE
jgi:lysophospholipase L1-like esterase